MTQYKRKILKMKIQMVSNKFCASRIISFDFFMLSVCWSTQSESVLSISVWTSRCSLFFIFGFPWKCYRVCNLLNVWCMLLNRITIAKWWRQIKPYRKSDYMDITDHMYTIQPMTESRKDVAMATEIYLLGVFGGVLWNKQISSQIKT